MNKGVFNWLPWMLALCWFGFRWIAGEYTGYDFERGRNAGVMANLLIILVLLFITFIVRHRNSESAGSGLLSEVRAGLATGLKYIVATIALMAMFYTVVSPELSARRDHDRAMNASLVDTPEKLEQIKAGNSHLRSLSSEEILRAANERTDLMTSPGVVISSSFIGLLFATLLYAFLGAFIFRQFIRMR